MMRVGHGTASIALIPGEPMGGYADRVGGISGVLTELAAHAFTVHDGTRRFTLIVFDAICVNEDLVDAIRRSLSADICWVSATHTHAGPECGCHPGGVPTPPSVRERLLQAAAAAFSAAVAQEQPLGARLVRIEVAGLAGTRAATESAVSTIPVDVLVFDDADNAVRGVLLNVPVHPTVLPASNTLASPDLAGGVREAVRERFGATGSQPWTIVSTGAAGDISTRHTRSAQTPAAIAELGRVVADALADALTDALTPPLTGGSQATNVVWRFDDTTQVKVSSRSVDVLRASEDELPLPWADHSAGSDLSRNDYTLRQGIELARELRVGNALDHFRVELSAVMLGSLTLVAVPGELFLRLGETIRSRLSPAIVVGYANGYLGYFPDVSSYDAPTYETYASATRKGTGELIVEEAVLLGDLLRRSR